MSEVKVRGGYRSVAKDLLNQLDALFGATDLDIDKIKAISKVLQNYHHKLSILNESIQSKLSDDEELKKDLEESMKRDIVITEYLVKVENSLKNVEHIQTSFSTTRHSFESPSGLNLPKLNLPCFDGNLIHWTNFIDVFNTAVHFTEMSNVQKFTYLIGQLRGEALKLLDGFSITDAHYEEALNLLRETFGQPKRIIQCHLHALFDLKEPKVNSQSLSEFRSSFECHIRSLESLDTKINEAGFVIVALLLRKLPTSIRENINRTANNTCWTLDDFRKAISNEINLLQSIEPEKQNLHFEKGLTKKSSFGKVKSEPKPIVTTLNVNTNLKRSNVRQQCQFCSQTHSTYACTKLITPQAKNQKAIELNLCVNCLSNKHKVHKCTSKYNCKHCHGRHNSALCLKNPVQTSDNVNTESDEKSVAAVASSPSLINSTAIPIAQMQIINDHSCYTIKALFDQGAQKTFILRSVAVQLKLKIIARKTMAIDGWQDQGSSQSYEQVSFRVETEDGPIELTAYVVDKLPSRINMPGLLATKRQLINLGIKLADPDVSTELIDNISLIVGVDNYYRFVRGHNQYNGIHVISSCLGGMVVGPLMHDHDNANNQTVDVVTILKVTADTISNSSADDISKIWNLDSIGLFPNEESYREKSVLNDFENNIQFKDGKYIASLPWKRNHPSLPTNYAMAKGCLYQLIKRLQSQGSLKVYNEVITNQLKSGFIEEITPNTPIAPEAKLHYLPHHGVKKDSETTPLRVVFNCSAGKCSLNDCLESGPSLINELGQILLRFRLHKFACSSDIEKAFLNISLHERDRDSTRFLWLRDPNDLQSEIVTYRFKSVLFGAKASQFLLNASIRHHLLSHDSDLSKVIARNLYVDNLIGTFDHESELYEFYVHSKELFNDAGLTLREWITNSPAIQNVCRENNDAINKSDYKLLGLCWDVQGDMLMYPEVNINKDATTKRQVLQASARVFDPLGYILPVIVRARLFIQTLWKAKITWDETLCEEFQTEWKVIASEIETILNLAVPRHIIFHNIVTVHAFCDASFKAYGAAVYFVSDGQSHLIMAKAKITGIKTLTIPKLELTAATILARLLAYIFQAYEKELEFGACHAWSDSQIVLRWLKTTKPLQPYIQNRVDEIHRLIPQVSWRYVPSTDNPSDMLSRGTRSTNLLSSKLWLNGPHWLNHPDSWPSWDDLNNVVNVGNVDNVNVNVVPSFISIINFNDYHCMRQILIVTALVLRFASNLRSKRRNEPLQVTSMKEEICHHLDAESMREAEIVLIKQVQRECFPDEIAMLKSPSKPTNNRIKELGLFMHNDVMRCSRRIDHSNLEYDSKYPILLPAKHKFTELLITYLHKRRGHIGTSHTIVVFRQMYWCVRARQTIKKVVSRCMICKKLFGPPFRTPMAPPLPRDRVMRAKPFSVTGIDYTGVLTVKLRRSTIKVYIVLFTCALTRAVHLELVEDNSCKSFLLALRRFIGRRSTPQKIYSDNATTFVGAADYLRRLQQHPSIETFLRDNKIEWKFIPARAPWFGGFWERMIGLTKNALKKILRNSLVTKEELETVLVEVENQLNHRPLTYVEDELHSIDALTPADLIYGHKLQSLPSSADLLDEDVSYGEPSILTKRQRFIQRLQNHFWKRWMHEYLTSLRNTRSPNYKASTFQEGDVVLIYDEGPRLQWKLGRITKLHRSEDGYVRSVCVKTAGSTLTRPVRHLYPLELHLKTEEETSEEGSLDVAPEDTSIEPRKQRAVAIKARKLIASQL